MSRNIPPPKQNFCSNVRQAISSFAIFVCTAIDTFAKRSAIKFDQKVPILLLSGAVRLIFELQTNVLHL